MRIAPCWSCVIGAAWMVTIAAPAQADQSAPVNLAPNSQWEMMSGWEVGSQENSQGTGIASPIDASANTVGTIGSATFSVTTTGELSVGDLVFARDTHADACFARSPMRIVALVPNASMTVRTPQGCVPSSSGATTLVAVTSGNRSTVGTGSGPDGWTKTTSLPMWRNEDRGPYARNMPRDVGAYAALGMTKDQASPEHLYIQEPPQTLAKFRGRTVVFGIYGYQKSGQARGTWRIWANDSVEHIRTPCASAVDQPGYQWLECSFKVPSDARYLAIGVELDGATGSTYYFADPVLSIGTSIGGVANYQKPRQETLVPKVHISPIGWINASITFPAAAASFCGPQVTCFEHDLYAETGGAIAPTVIRCFGQLEGINAGSVAVGTPYARLMAWYDRGTAPEKSGSFLAQYAADVKSYAAMDLPLDQTDTTPDLLGTGIYVSAIAADRWYNVSEEIDSCTLD